MTLLGKFLVFMAIMIVVISAWCGKVRRENELIDALLDINHTLNLQYDAQDMVAQAIYEAQQDGIKLR